MNKLSVLLISPLLFAVAAGTTVSQQPAPAPAPLERPTAPPASVESSTAPPATVESPALPPPGTPVAPAVSLLAVNDLTTAALADLDARIARGDLAAALAAGRFWLTQPSDAEHQRAADYLTKAADAKIVEAELDLADVYSSGITGVSADLVQAAALYRRAADAGSNEARRKLADLLLDDDTRMANPAAAAVLLKAAAHAGDTDASLELARLYASGIGVFADGVLARQLLGTGIATGDADAYLALGTLYRLGAPGIPIDIDAALTNYGAAAAVGNLTAKRQIADIWVRGEGVTADVPKAVALLEEVAATDPAAFVTLGEHFVRGDFVPYDAARAIGYFERAATAGVADGNLRLGDLYRDGMFGLPPNGVEAAAYYTRALDGTSRRDTAATRLAELFRNGAEGLPPDVAVAKTYYERAIVEGNLAAQRALAAMLIDTAAPGADVSESVALLADAAEKHDADAATALSTLYLKGEVVEPDYEAALRYAELARAEGNTSARLNLAVGLLEGPLARERGAEAVALLSELIDRKATGAAFEFGRLALAGKIRGTSAADGLNLLESAALGGDRAAAEYLIEVLRDGEDNVVPPNRQRAIALLDRTIPLFGEPAATIQRIRILATSATDPTTMAEISNLLSTLPRADATRLLGQLGRSSANAYVFAVQERLAQRGMFSGQPNGIVNGATVDAIQAVCEQAKMSDKCSTGPLSPSAIDIVSKFVTSSS